MEVSGIYLSQRFGRVFLDFLRHWYIDGFFRAVYWAYNFLERLDKFFALRITLKNFFQPLYQDYTLIGYFYGIIFRLGRLLIGGVLYLFFVVLAVALYLLWALTPLVAVYKIFVGNG